MVGSGCADNTPRSVYQTGSGESGSEALDAAVDGVSMSSSYITAATNAGQALNNIYHLSGPNGGGVMRGDSIAAMWPTLEVIRDIYSQASFAGCRPHLGSVVGCVRGLPLGRLRASGVQDHLMIPWIWFTITLGEAPADIAASLSVDVFTTDPPRAGLDGRGAHASCTTRSVDASVYVAIQDAHAGRQDTAVVRVRPQTWFPIELQVRAAGGVVGVGVTWRTRKSAVVGDGLVMIEHREGVRVPSCRPDPYRPGARVRRRVARLHGALCAGKSFTRAGPGVEPTARLRDGADRAGCIHPERFGAGA